MKHCKRLIRSFIYALRGFFYSVRNERNMRIHLVCMAYMYYYLFAYDFFVLSRTQLAIILLTNALVISSELFNTAIERAVDTATKSKVATARFAKDCAASAVLVCAIFAVAVGISLLWQPEAFSALFKHYAENPILILLFAASVIIFVLFIFSFDILDGRKKK